MTEINDAVTSIAIIGMSGRFPGASDLQEFWTHLCRGAECIRSYSAEELASAGVDAKVLSHPNFVNAGAPLENSEMFDAGFFGFSAHEAEAMDPQRRVFLECVWHSLEDAACDPTLLAGPIGIFAGSSLSSYFHQAMSNSDLMSAVDAFQLLIGNDKDHLALQAAYKLNFRGPALTIQTTCSTSLVAVCLACQSLLNFESDLALAGGVSVKFPQHTGYLYEPDGIVSPDGHCRPFDKDARGTVEGNGVGVVVLKRLSDALRDRDRIRAVIRGAAINNDGSLKVSYTAPSVEGQAAVIASALSLAGVSADTISYVEAHGTATPLGDPVELAALTQSFRADTQRRNFCAIGSVKGNIGHLDAAAGIAGLIKTVLCLEHGTLVPSLHFQQANPAFDLEQSPFHVQSSLAEWKNGLTPRRAGVSSFGIGGTNAHVVLEEAPSVKPSGTSRSMQILPISARTEAALQRSCSNLCQNLADNRERELADVACTLAVGRRSFRHRRFILARDTEDAIVRLRDMQPSSVGAARESVELAFLFPGQGVQHPGMAKGLYGQEALFRKEVDYCANFLRPVLGVDVRDVLYGDSRNEEQLRQTMFAQPTLFIIEYALARTLMQWGIVPTAMIGHSLGEYTAACLAGVFSLDDALTLIALRAKLMQSSAPGVMLAAGFSEREARLLLNENVSLAAVNGPEQCVFSGTEPAIAKLEVLLNQRGLPGTRIRTSHAFHSALMDPLLPEFEAHLKRMELKPPSIPYLSNVTGTWQTEAAAQPGYWVEHLRHAVRFADNVNELRRRNNLVCLEVGPGNSLGALIKSYLCDADSEVVINAMPRAQEQRSDVEFLAKAVGELWQAGVPVCWSDYYAAEDRNRVALPLYPFEQQEFKISPANSLSFSSSIHLTKNSDVASWYYLPSWRQTAPVSSQARQGRYLVFLDSEGLGSKVVEKLRSYGADVTAVVIGDSFRRESDACFSIRPAVFQDYAELWQAVAEGGMVPQTVLHLWNVTNLAFGPGCGFGSILYLAQALSKHSHPTNITVVSNCLQSVSGLEEIHAEKATLLGACRVVPMEYPNLAVRSVDIEWPGLDTVEQIIAEAAVQAPPQVVAYRGPRRWVEAFESIALPSTTNAHLREGGVYLITGGLGGIGLTLANYIANESRSLLVLVGRHRPDEKSPKWKQIAAIEQAGSEVMVCEADVAKAEDMREVFEQVKLRFGPLNGVIHAAGIASHGLIAERSTAAIEQVLAPKIAGTLVLHELLRDSQLDFFVCCSSLASILGGISQCDYSAANAFLDAYAQREAKRRDRLTLSINWDGWAEVGMSVQNATPAELEANLALKNAILPHEGVRVFRDALTLGVPQVCVSTMPLPARIDQLRSFMESFATEVIPRTSRNKRYPRPELATQYIPPSSPTEQALADIWQELLGIDRVGRNDDFFELGGHSLLAMQMMSRLRKMRSLDLPLRLLFENANIAAIASLIDQMPGSDAVLQSAAIQPLPREVYRQSASS